MSLPGGDAANSAAGAQRTPRVWLARPDEARIVTRLLVGFRDELGYTWPSDNAFLAGVEKLLDDRHTDYVLGAVHDDVPPEGVAQLRFRHGLWRAGGDCLVEDLYVAPGARRSGLARAIMTFSLDRARERGCRRAELDVNERNAAALALYEGLGFSARANSFGGRDLYMRLHLDTPEDA